MAFKIKSEYKPAGDQPKAIEGLVKGYNGGLREQTLLGVTGSGKTFTVANVIEQTQLPTLVIAHNKTLAAQLCNEFREFFPENAVEYFVSYYDYYQPEAYIPSSDTYIEKDAQINDEIDRLRHAATQAILKRKDTIIVASVSAIYALGSPKEYENIVLHLTVGQPLDRRALLEQLVEMQFERTNAELTRGSFRLRGQVFDIMPINEERIYRCHISDKIESIEIIDAVSRRRLADSNDAWFFPAKHYVAGEDARNAAVGLIESELENRLAELQKKGKILEHERLKRKTRYDIEMIKNVGYCNGIENYSSHFDGRAPGEAPYTLLDFFKYGAGDFLTVIDESHVTLPQIRAMFRGDRARKDTLIEHGFRLPSARDNRPLTFDEFYSKTEKMMYVSATPAEFEMLAAENVVEQIVRPTGLVDPELVIVPVSESDKNPSQVDDVIVRIEQRISQGERALVTTLTKKMAEDLTDFLKKSDIRVAYLHSDIKTIERIEIITSLRKGDIDVIVGVNLLREGLDIPEVSLVAVLDADKEGFLRSDTSLIQTIGRAARNVNGMVVLYADEMTGSIDRAVKETQRRRKKQLQYNKEHGITPKTIQKAIKNVLEEFGIDPTKQEEKGKRRAQRKKNTTLELDLIGDDRPLKQIIKDKEVKMKEAAQKLEFELAAILRDEIRELKLRDKSS